MRPAPAPALTGRNAVLDVVERAVLTGVEAVVAAYLAKGSLDLSTLEVTLLGVVAAILAGVRSLVATRVARPGPSGWLEDTVVRTAFTFGEVLVAGLVAPAMSSSLSLSATKAAAIAAAAAALATLKCALARAVGNQNNASLVSGVASAGPSSAGDQQGQAVAAITADSTDAALRGLIAILVKALGVDLPPDAPLTAETVRRAAAGETPSRGAGPTSG